MIAFVFLAVLFCGAVFFLGWLLHEARGADKILPASAAVLFVVFLAIVVRGAYKQGAIDHAMGIVTVEAAPATTWRVK